MWAAIDASNVVDVIAVIVALFLLAHIVMGNGEEDTWGKDGDSE